MVFTGIYRKGTWAFVENERGERDIIIQPEYEAMGLQPAFNALRSEEDYMVDVLAHRSGEPI